jgi:hypothetical protein
MPPKRTLVGGTDSRAKRPKTGLVYERASDRFNKGIGVLRCVLLSYVKLSTVATLENGNRVRQNPPVALLQEEIRIAKKGAVTTGTSVVYWMRMEDMRSTSPDKPIPLVLTRPKSTIIVHSRQLLFWLRNTMSHLWHFSSSALRTMWLMIVEPVGSTLFCGTSTYSRRTSTSSMFHSMSPAIPQGRHYLRRLFSSWSHGEPGAFLQTLVRLTDRWPQWILSFTEYEIDEARRDLKVLDLAKEKGFFCDFHEDKMIVPPFTVSTQQGKQFSVSAHFYLNGHLENPLGLLTMAESMESPHRCPS